MLKDRQLDALVYPTIRRKAARVGDPQRGSNCQLSAASGLPALSMPAGFTPDGLPVGLELLGLPFDDARLLALAYSFERVHHVRRPPANTPALVSGRAPDPVAYEVGATGTGGSITGKFVYAVTTGDLTYEVSVSGVPADQVHSITLHRAVESEDGPVVHRLAGPGVNQTSGVLTLTLAERDALVAGRLYLSVYTSAHPRGAARGTLVTP